MNNLESIRSLAKNSFFMLLTRIAVPACSFFITIFVARYLGPLEFGQYSLAFKFFILFRIICFLGLYPLITREVARNKDRSNDYFVNATFIGLWSSLIFYALMLAMLYLMKYEYIILAASAIVGIALFFDTIAFFSEAVFIAYEKFIYVFYITLFTNIIWVTVSIIALALNYGILYLMAITVIVSIISSLARLHYLNKHLFRLMWNIKIDFCKLILRSIPVFSLINIISSIILNMDVIILSKLRNSLEVGWYSPSIKFSSLGFLFVYNFADALFPIISSAYQTAKEKFLFFCEKSIKYLIVILLPLTLILTFLSGRIVLLFFGDKYINSIPALKILIWVPVPLSFSYIFSRILIASNRERLDLLTLAIGFIFNLIFMAILTSQWGYIGTSIALLLSMTFISSIHYLFVKKLVFKFSLVRLLYKPGLSMIIMILVIFCLRKINPYLACSISLVAYFVCIFIFKAVNAQDVLIIKQALQRNVNPHTPP